MRSQSLIRLSGWALIVGAVLFAIGYLLKPSAESVIQVYADARYVPAATFTYIGALLILIGLPAMYLYQSARGGLFGLISFVLTFLGLASLEVGSGGVTSAIFQLIAANPETQFLIASGGVLENSATVMAFYIPSLLATNLGILLLGISTYRARVYTRGPAVLMIAGVLLIFVAESIGISLAMAGFAWCGLALAGSGKQPDVARVAVAQEV